MKRRWKIFIGILIVLTVSAVILRALTAHQKTLRVSTPDFTVGQNPLIVTVEGNASFPTSTFPLYTADSHTNLKTQFKRIADQLNLIVAPYSENNYYNSDSSIALTYEPSQQYVYYSNSQNKTTVTALEVNKASAILSSQAFLNSIGFSSADFTLDPTSVQFYTSKQGELDPDISGPILGLHFIRTLQSLPVTIEASTINYVEIYVNSNGVFKARFPGLIFSLTQQNSVSPLSIEQIKSNIQSGKYKIIGNPVNTSTHTVSLSPLTTVSLHVQNFEYRLDESQNIFIPFIHFIGTGIPSDNSGSVTVELITPAIATQ